MLPYGRQSIEDDDIEAVVAALKSDFLTTGPRVAEFEAALQKVTGAKHAVVVSNGTTALHLAALALGVGPGDVVIVASVTFVATANAVRYCGGDVVFADVDAQTGLMGARELEEAIGRIPPGKKLKAIFPVHLAGQCVDLNALKKIAQREGAKLMVDACHALGSTHEGVDGGLVSAGSCALEDMAVFSFHPVKTIAMGEGGAITTNDDEVAARLRRLRSHGLNHQPASPIYPDQGLDENGAPNPWYMEQVELGYNYREADILCALGLSQLAKLDRFIARRRELADYYDGALSGLSDVLLPPSRVKNGLSAWHLYAPRFDFNAIGKSRARVMREMREQGVGSQVHYLPVHRQPYYRTLYGDMNLPGADAYYDRTLSIPLYPSLSNEEADKVVRVIKDVILT